MPQRTHLPGKLLGGITTADREQGTVGAQSHGRQFRALALEACDTARGKLLRIGGRNAAAAHQDLATTRHTGEQRLDRVGNGPSQGLGGLVFQVSAVDELLLDALLDHGFYDA